MIKKIIAYVPCHVFYYLGDKVANILNLVPDDDKFDHVSFMLYQVYNGLMLYSTWWNDFGGLDVWGNK